MNLWERTDQSRAPGSGYLRGVSSCLRGWDSKRPCSSQCSKGRGRSCGLFTFLTQHLADSCSAGRTRESGKQMGLSVGCARAPGTGHLIPGWKSELAGRVGCPFRDQLSGLPVCSQPAFWSFWSASYQAGTGCRAEQEDSGPIQGLTLLWWKTPPSCSLHLQLAHRQSLMKSWFKSPLFYFLKSVGCK